jgi:NAD-dependent deacetylase
MDKLRINPMMKVIVLTGAGISAESGIKTFRDNDGLWENHKVEHVATPEAFIANPELVWDFYKQRYQSAKQALPNQGHYALVELEKALGSNFRLITQNVDGLHTKAGNKNVLDMHGNLNTCFCTVCKKSYQLAEVDLSVSLPLCQHCNGLLRPNIVWFGEIPYHLDLIERLISNCNVFIVVGTSGVVYPAAGFVMTAKYKGAVTVGINLEKPHNAGFFDYFYVGKAGKLLPELVENWLK